MKSKLFTLGIKDFIKGLILAIITAIITLLINELQLGSELDTTLLHKVGITSLIAFLSYLAKNLFSNSDGDFATPEKKEA